MSVEMKAKICWIHCNKCFELLLRKRINFFLLSCSHIMCESCLSRSGTKATALNSVQFSVVEIDQQCCPICKRSVASKKISTDMSPKYKRYFHPEPLKNAADFEVFSFQTFHFNNYEKAIYRAEVYYEQKKKEMQEMLENANKIKKVFQELSQETAKWDAKVAQYKNNKVCTV